MLDARQLEPGLTEQEMLLRDSFVAEYIRDFDSYQACLRLGFQATYAVQWAHTLFNDGYVQRKLSYMLSKPVATPEQEAADRAMVEMTLRRVMQRGSDAARVSAVRQFCALKGWSNDDGTPDVDLVEQFKRVSEELPS